MLNGRYFPKKKVLRSFAVMIFGFAAFFCSSCDMLELRTDDTLLAKAYGSRLYLEDIREVLPAGVSPEDSVAIIRRYIDRWIDEQVMIYNARQVLKDDQMNFERTLTGYKNALIIHAFETHLTQTEMDSLVTESEILEYYEANKRHFVLKNNIVQANYIKLPVHAQNAARVRSLYRSDDPGNLEELENYSLEHAATYFIGKDNWITFDEILIDMPLEITDQARYLRNNRFVEITDDYYRYFLYIHNYRLRGDVSPVDFERDNIRLLILNWRRRQFIQEKRRELFNQAIEANRIETFF